jgi:hypothetical protein
MIQHGTCSASLREDRVVQIRPCASAERKVLVLLRPASENSPDPPTGGAAAALRFLSDVMEGDAVELRYSIHSRRVRKGVRSKTARFHRDPSVQVRADALSAFASSASISSWAADSRRSSFADAANRCIC